jgi:hypothetical protein
MRVHPKKGLIAIVVWLILLAIGLVCIPTPS